MFGDHLTSTVVTSRPNLTSRVKAASQRIAEREVEGGHVHNTPKARGKSFATRPLSMIEGERPVLLQTRESIKMACARIAASLQSHVNVSKNAERKAKRLKDLDGSDHDTYFAQVCCASIYNCFVIFPPCDALTTDVCHPRARPSNHAFVNLSIRAHACARTVPSVLRFSVS